jgi:hypothetical protein
MARLVSRWMLLGLLSLALGCNALRDPGDITPDSLLHAAKSSPTSISVDIYWARTTPTDPEWHDKLWEAVQEDCVPVETRRALAENGLRVGVVGGNPNPMIARLLNPEPDATPEEREQKILSGMAKVTRRLLTLRPGQRGEIQSTDSVSDFTLIRHRAGQLTGRPYQSAQGLYAMEIERKEGDRIEVELVPEVHYGQPKMQFTSAGPGVMVHRLGRDVEVFDDLRTQVSLTSGEMLVVAALPNSGSKLGGLFHTCEGPDGSQQKILLIRLSQVPRSDLLAGRDGSWPWD